MKPMHKHLAAAALAVLAAAAGAQTPPPAAGAPAPQMQGEHRGPGNVDPGKMREHMRERMEQHMARREARLKTILQITPAQEGAWSAFTAAMRPPANMQRPPREDFSKLTTPERIDRMRAMRAQRMAMMDKRADATKTFYAQLSPAQQKAFDEVTARRFRGDRGHRGHGMGMHRG